ncbi:CapA family protein [Haloarcula salinisoli]|uniref:CapA family protein n=1 Tax=Haloarcula salinisoli TaxID=2487746 RepID=A0A8J8C968_9EURY|nr:CapA family protein [Halomicroarcula salinisoli]MBX0287404.1 CapA family protein [Halomicroarcula salinisoli]MBX0305022.1 CapA family protein [Halomicroarcula salinisoli]
MTAEPFTLAATGDAIIGRPVTDRVGDERFDELCSVLSAADAALTQVEPVVVDDDCLHASLPQVTDQYHSPSPFPGAIMGTSPACLDELSAMGCNLFTAASNHAYDFGPGGVRCTLSSMRDREQTVAGLGEDLTVARSPSYLETPGGRVGLVDATTSVPPGGEAGVSTPAFDGQAGVNPLHVEWTYRVPEARLAQLREIAAEAGIEAVKGEWLRRTNPDWADDDAYYFMQMRFAPATEAQPPGIYQTLVRRDRDAVLAGVREAAANADRVVLALHAHQSADGNRNTSAPPPFLRRFARKAVDIGADAVVVTGPHTLRGVEIHEGRPICYSLGNFCFHEETVYRVPDAPEDVTDDGVPDVRGDSAGEDADGSHDVDNWRSVVPVCAFDADGGLSELTLYPCTLGPTADPPRRGTPALATGDTADSVLDTVERRSEPFGTRIRRDGNVGVVEL